MNFELFRELLLMTDRPAITGNEVVYSYRTFAQLCFSVSEKIGAGPVAILAPSGVEYAAAAFGTWLAGQIAIPLQAQHPIDELEYILRDSRPQTFLVHHSLEAKAKLLSEKTLTPYSMLDGHQIEEARRPKIVSSNPALIIYTSGTTNRPKGVVTTFGALEAQVQSLQMAWSWSHRDSTIDVLPLNHVHGLVNILVSAVASGAHCEMLDKFSADVVWNRILDRKINVFMAVPTIYQRLIEFWDSKEPALQREMSSAAKKMRLFVSGSAALPAGTFLKWEAITGHRLLERYGMTEFGMALSNPYEGERKVGTVGMPLPGVSVRLDNGEIQVRGKNVFREYLNQPALTRDSFTSDGWFKTGDVAETDGQGYYRILGRMSQDIIKSGGYKISALEIESVLSENSAIREIAVVGVADDEWGERVVAAIVTGDTSFNEEQLKLWAKERLAVYKIPTRWLVVDTLPRNAMGKIMKPRVRELFGKKTSAK